MVKPKLIIAGPGSGKTHNLVNEIASHIPLLAPHQILAAITYTNAATHSIKTKLEKKIKIPPNVFVGTTYSFFNTFILLPYASIYGKAELDKIFIEYDVTKKATEITDKKTFNSPLERSKYLAGVQSNILKGLLNKGIIPFDQIAKISAELIQEKRIRYLVGNKIPYLFVDEFQDATAHQYQIFDAIRKEKKTIMYKVGDPEQYISNHTIRGRKTPNFEKIPIMTVQSSCDVTEQTINRRSSKQIVDFINNFNTQIQQVSSKGESTISSINFIAQNDIDSIVQKFQETTSVIEVTDDFVRFYLAFANNTYESVRQKYGLSTISNEHIKSHSKLSESLKIISAATGLSGKKLCLEYCLDPVQYRMLAVNLLKSTQNSANELKTYISIVLKLKLDHYVDFERLYERLKALTSSTNSVKKSELTTSIHKSKGLEADAVLIIARTNNELAKWLETDKPTRYADKTDQLRLGFVAFSRAKEILCIACLEKINAANRQKLTGFNVTFLE